VTFLIALAWLSQNVTRVTLPLVRELIGCQMFLLHLACYEVSRVADHSGGMWLLVAAGLYDWAGRIGEGFQE
jgi:hypothetical protein